jgi:protein TonB
MSSYRGYANGPDRAKSIAAVVAVHAALAAVILSGLNVRIVGEAVDRLSTFDVRTPPPPPPPKPPPPKPRPQQAKQPEGAPAKKAAPSPVVAPQPRIPVESPIDAAKVAGTGSASTSGAGSSGTGTGAGGTGSGPGGGGPDYSRFTPARLVRNLTRGDYARIALGRLPNGRAMASLRLDARGLVTHCQIVRSSGDATVDAGLCPLLASRLRFRPALDDMGRPIPYGLQYVATWHL